MESTISPILADLFMGSFEVKALSTAANPPRLWRRYVDDTFMVQKSFHKSKFLKHINSVDKFI